jgi:hypothetical protein
MSERVIIFGGFLFRLVVKRLRPGKGQSSSNLPFLRRKRVREYTCCSASSGAAASFPMLRPAYSPSGCDG